MKPLRVKSFSSHAHPNYKWEVSGTRPDGKAERRRFKTKVEALEFADDLNREIRAIGWQAVGMSDAQRTEAAECHKMLEGTGHSLTEAVRHYLAHLAQTERSVSVSEAIEALMLAKEGKGLSAVHRRNLNYELRPLREEFGDTVLAVLTSADLDAWLTSRKLSPTHYRSALRHLSILFNHAVKTGTAPANPVKGIEAPRSTGEGEIGILAPTAMRALLLLAREEHPDMLAALAIQGFAGLRTAEVKRLDWSAVNLADSCITVGARQAKNRARRVVHIHPNLAAWLAPLRGEGRVAPKCFDPCAAVLRRKLAQAKHEWPENGLRHSFVTYRYMLDGDDARTAAEAGNTPEILHRHYKGLANAKSAAAWFAISPTGAGEPVKLAGRGGVRAYGAQ